MLGHNYTRRPKNSVPLHRITVGEIAADVD